MVHEEPSPTFRYFIIIFNKFYFIEYTIVVLSLFFFVFSVCDSVHCPRDGDDRFVPDPDEYRQSDHSRVCDGHVPLRLCDHQFFKVRTTFGRT